MRSNSGLVLISVITVVAAMAAIGVSFLAEADSSRKRAVASEEIEKLREFVDQRDAGVQFVSIQDLPEASRERMSVRAEALQAHSVFEIEGEFPTLSELTLPGKDGFIDPATLHKAGFLHVKLVDPEMTGLRGVEVVSGT